VPERVRVQREGAQLQAQGKWSAGEGDDKERFLADLRALRDTVALEFDELAARAHYPSDVLKEAESGPSLPGLPILAAFVRACDGDVPEWEERWRRLCFESHADPGLPVRPAGASPAAVAGARAGVSVAPPEAYDAERIRAVLRGAHGSSDRGARGAAARRAAPPRVEPDAAAEPRVPESPASWSGGAAWDETARWDAERGAQTTAGWDAGTQPGTSWDGFQRDAGARWDGAVTDLASTPANGNHHVSQPGDGSSAAAVIETPDADRADTIRHDLSSADWLQDGELTSPPATESGRADRAEGEPPAAAPDSWFTPRETADHAQTRPAADTEPSPAAADTWFTPREPADSGPTPSPPAEPPQEHTGSAAAELVTGFWTPSAAASRSAEVQRPGPSPAKGRAIPRASWPAPAETPASDTPAAADRTTPILSQAAATPAAPPRTITGPAVPPGPVVPPSERRPDRLYPVRLLVVIVVAALIGSILVLLLR
jgi:hypothetical protein